MKVEPMSVEEIKDLIYRFDLSEVYEPRIVMSDKRRIFARLVLSWAHERARAQRLAFKISPTCTLRSHTFGTAEWREHADCPWTWTDQKWTNEVLDEIGWPKEQRS